MPAPVAYRRWDNGMQETLSPVEMYAPTVRYAIVALGLVISVITLPAGVLPALLTGQTAIVSATLNVGDRI